MRNACALAAALSFSAQAADLPQVAPPGPGTAKPDNVFLFPGSVNNRYERRLEHAPLAVPPSPPPPTPATLFPRPGGAVTDTGIPLRGLGGALRDPGGGLWTCTPRGCFSPSGQFFQLWRPRPEPLPE
jgi:hypothetical protein